LETVMLTRLGVRIIGAVFGVMRSRGPADG
jgi:hypothetical protein